MSDPLTVPKYETPSRNDDPTWDRMEDQIDWYDRKSIRYQKIYKRIKVIEIVAAATIPFLSALNIAPAHSDETGHVISWIIGGLGVLITILEGVLQLNQYQQNWIAYRSACEGLKHEKYTYLAKAPPYSDAPSPHALLAERIESLISQEHAKWATVQQQANVKPVQGDTGRPTP